MTKLYTEEMISTKIGAQSLIGASGPYPTSWGNYFWLTNSSRVVNFWAENLTHANKEFNLNGQVKIRRYKSEDYDFCLIDDERISKEYYYNKLCFTGGKRPPYEVAKDMYEYLCDDTNELEYYTDPVAYYAKRGETYDPKTGIISYQVKAKSRKLDKNYTIEKVDTIKHNMLLDLDIDYEKFSS